MLPFLFRTKVCALSVLFHLSSIYVASSASCGCSSLIIPVHVDVLIPKDPTDLFAGLKSNANSLRRLDETYNIYGVFCQPDTVSRKNADIIQLLVHGITYTSQYWSPPVEEFRNYSYSTFSCDRGLSSLAIDWVGVGLSSRPVNASDVQYLTCAAAVSQVARHLKNVSILPGVRPFKKVIGIGHSAGSALLNVDAIVEGPRSPFDGLILTASLVVEPGEMPPVSTIPSARHVDPVRWGALDPAYITTTPSNRSIFYPADTTAFSPRMFIFDYFTKDVGSMSSFLQIAIMSLTTRYTGPVAKVVGSEDQLFCLGTGRCVDVTALTAAERILWPDARSFEVVVAEGGGHALNLDFFAQGPFNTLVNFVNQFSAL
ncbi:Alpha/beta hydrolase family-domain-containing protein [Mycena leptocephala]|nr:Alpha/beta hydrolase family-domain-containing protein [Mycena leptocephala]